jgi:hypothetical protein
MYDYDNDFDYADIEDYLDMIDYWQEHYWNEVERADYLENKMKSWRLRAEKARNLAQDLSLILRALRKRGKLSLQWNDESAAKWHNLPKEFREYISRG